MSDCGPEMPRFPLGVFVLAICAHSGAWVALSLAAGRAPWWASLMAGSYLGALVTENYWKRWWRDRARSP